MCKNTIKQYTTVEIEAKTIETKKRAIVRYNFVQYILGDNYERRGFSNAFTNLKNY